MSMTRALVMIAPDTDPHSVLGEIFKEGILGEWSGYWYNEGGGLLSVEIKHPRALDLLDAHPKVTRMPSLRDTAPDAVAHTHLDKLHDEVKGHIKKKKGKLDKDTKISARELHQHLHDLYKTHTHAFHPDF